MLSEWPFQDQPKGWRQLGCELALAQQGSSPEYYYVLLAKVKALIEADMEFLRPGQPDAAGTAVEEKVADMTHRGPGL
jgi:hypothetical protein